MNSRSVFIVHNVLSELLLEQIGLISKQVTEGNEKQMLLDMGDGVFGHAELTKPNKFYVDVGLKVFVEMSTTESLRFCYEKVYHLRKKVESLGDQEVEIRTHLDMVEFNLEELRRVL